MSEAWASSGCSSVFSCDQLPAAAAAAARSLQDGAQHAARAAPTGPRNPPRRGVSWLRSDDGLSKSTIDMVVIISADGRLRQRPARCRIPGHDDGPGRSREAHRPHAAARRRESAHVRALCGEARRHASANVCVAAALGAPRGARGRRVGLRRGHRGGFPSAPEGSPSSARPRGPAVDDAPTRSTW